MNYVFYKEKDGKVIESETITESAIKRVAEAAQDVMRIYRVEEIFHMVMMALFAFNREVSQESDRKRIVHGGVIENELFRIRINQCAASFLTALEMYQYYLSPDDGCPPFTVDAKVLKDDRFDVCKALRNYIQHVSTVGVNISWGSDACACGEKLSSLSVAADAEEMKTNKNKMRTWNKLERYVKGKKELDLYETFNGVVDVLFAMHQKVRMSKEYSVRYEASAKFLSEMQARLLARGLSAYRYEDDDETECRGTVPYFYDRQRMAIDYFRECYRCGELSSKGSFYSTTAPQNLVSRMATADRIIERYVRANGVVSKIGNDKIINTQFTSKKMRDWYLT